MRWELAEEQEMFRDSLKGWLERAATSEAVRIWLESGEPGEFENRFAGEGWLAVGSAEELGGQGGGLLELALTAEQLARVVAPSSAWLANAIALPALMAAHDAAEKALTGESYVALAVNADKPVDAPVDVTIDDGGTLSGSVPNVLGADRAATLLVPAHSGTDLRLYAVAADQAGVTLHKRELLDQSRTIADVSFDGARAAAVQVDASAFLGEAAQRAAVLIAADSLGAMERMLELAVEYSKQRQQFGVPIGSFQAIKHAAATMLVAVEAARSITYFAAASVDTHHDDAELHAATAKSQVTGSGDKAADSALTMHGAIGYTWEHDLQLLYKRAKLNQRLYGVPNVWNERIAAALPLVPVG